MWFTPEVRRILAYSKPVDLRKSIDGLVGLVKSVLEEDPLSGSLFVFVNRRGNYVKLGVEATISSDTGVRFSLSNGLRGQKETT